MDLMDFFLLKLFRRKKPLNRLKESSFQRTVEISVTKYLKYFSKETKMHETVALCFDLIVMARTV